MSFTNGTGPYGYTELSATYYAASRALADTTNALPYFVGSGLTVARQYPDKMYSSAKPSTLELILTIFSVFLLGLVSALFVPRLPLGLPRRGFDLFSWFFAFHTEELVAERSLNFGRNLDLRDIVDHSKDVRLYFPA